MKKKILIAFGIVMGVLVGIVVIFIGIQIVKAPNLSEVDAAPEGYLTTILDKDEQVMNTLYVTESNRIYVELDSIPKELQEAFIAIEDARFYKHHGIDLQGIMRAFVDGIVKGEFSQGASTITQQLLKNNVFTDWMSETSFYDSLCRKIQEQYLAIRLEGKYSKEWILENYLNTINLGGGTRGVQVAAQYYFGKDVSQLSLAESALIAGITKNPSNYNPLIYPEKSMERQELVLDAMLEQKYITRLEYNQAIREDVIAALNTNSENRGMRIFSWFEDAMLFQIVEDLMETYQCNESQAWDMIYSGGLTIYSTIDSQLQDLCETIAVDESWYTDNQEISIVMTDVSNGAVRAIVGSSKEKSGSLVYNRATDAIRQPGSVIKIIGEYAAALETGEISLGTAINDEPYRYSDGTQIRNSNGTYAGMTTVREAIADSSNVIALKTYQMVGGQKVYDSLQKFGITTLDTSDINEALAIGGTYHGVTNLEVTAAYNAIANSGMYKKPYFYTKVVDSDGKVLLRNNSIYEQAVSSETAELLTSAMEDVIKAGTGTSAAVRGVTLAGKSGTTNDKKDLWFVGFSSYYTCGIWGGYDDNSEQTNSGYVKKIWQKVMKEAHEGKTNLPITDTSELTQAKICTKCGNLAVDGLCDNTVQGNMTKTEYYMWGTVPTEVCDCHISVSICQSSGAIAGNYCPNVEEKAYLKTAVAGTADSPYVLPQGGEETCSEHKYFWDSWFDNSLWEDVPDDNETDNNETDNNETDNNETDNNETNDNETNDNETVNDTPPEHHPDDNEWNENGIPNDIPPEHHFPDFQDDWFW